MRAGFTLIEAVASMAIVTIAGSALLLGIASTLDTMDAIVEQAQADGLARQLMEEIAARRYAEPGAGPHQPTLGPESGEVVGASRLYFDDIDDYHGLDVSPPRDRWGVPCGRDDGQGGLRSSAAQAPSSTLAAWRQQVAVHYVSPADLSVPLSPGQASDYRLVRVTISRTEGASQRVLAQCTRVFSYVPQN